MVFRKSVGVTFLYVGVSIAIKFVLGMSMALLLNEAFPGRAIVRGILFLPLTAQALLESVTQGFLPEAAKAFAFDRHLASAHAV